MIRRLARHNSHNIGGFIRLWGGKEGGSSYGVVLSGSLIKMSEVSGLTCQRRNNNTGEPKPLSVPLEFMCVASPYWTLTYRTLGIYDMVWVYHIFMPQRCA